MTLFLLSQMEMDLLEARLQGQGKALKPRGDSATPVTGTTQVSGFWLPQQGRVQAANGGAL